MKSKLTEEEKWEIVGYVKVSNIRYLTLKTIDKKFMMPTEISKYSGLGLSQVSSALRALKTRDLVFCKNESSRKGRLYQTTDLGGEILDMILENEK
jgi:predicted transcriptional regulator